MHNRRALLFTGSAVFCSVLTGCAGSVVAQYYRIVAEPGGTDGATRGNFVLRSIIMPGYLDQTGVPKPSGRHMFATFDNQLWAGSLSGLLQATMVQNLASRLPDATIVGGGGAIDLPDSTIVEINVLTFAPDLDGSIDFQAEVSIKPFANGARQTRYIRLTAPAGGTTAPAIVAAMSQLWANFADRIGVMLRRGNA
jgi:uncharacterized lipoprotein YmbA